MSGPFGERPAPMAWTVSALLLAVSDQLGARFGALTVRGEISGFSRPASGHCYFSLRDSGGGQGLIRCAMFRRAAALLDFAPADGQQVELRGRIDVYEPRGELQLVAESLQRLGQGSLYEEFLRLRARLQAEGWFETARKRPIERHPRALAVVTSLGAAALRDVLTALRRRAPQVAVTVFPCLVQGAEAPAQVVAALGRAGAMTGIDTVLLVRGGGSLEDLWAFNDERVVRAVASSPLPVICGVGHETDITLADMAADLRAATPTAAAELAAPPQADLLAALDNLADHARRALRRRLEREQQRLDLIAHRLRAPAAALQLRRQQLDALAGRLAAAHPRQVLARGFAWMQDADGATITRSAMLFPGQAVTATFADGSARLLTQQVMPASADRA
jgi:exodeoxyribonuclease VII large subunit